MNPLEIHQHVAQTSGREVAEISPLAAELVELASKANEVAMNKPDVVTSFEKTIKPDGEAYADATDIMDYALSRVRDYMGQHNANDSPGTRVDALAQMLALKGWDEIAYNAAMATIHGAEDKSHMAYYYAVLAIALPQMALEVPARQAAASTAVAEERYRAYMTVWSVTGDPADLNIAITSADGINGNCERAWACVDMATESKDQSAISRAQDKISVLSPGYDQLILRANLLKVVYTHEDWNAIRNESEIAFRGSDQGALEHIYQALVESMVGNVAPQAIADMILGQNIEDTDIRNNIYTRLAAAFAQNGQEGKAHGTVSRISEGSNRCKAALEVAMVTRSVEAIGRVKNMVDFMSEDNAWAMSAKAGIVTGLAELTGDVSYLKHAIELLDISISDFGVYILPRYMAVAAAADAIIRGEFSEKIKRINAL